MTAPWRKAFAGIAALDGTVLQACQPDNHAARYTTMRPNVLDLAGRYVVVRQTVTADGLSALHGKPSVVELRADGTFDAKNVPPWSGAYTGAEVFAKLRSGSGRWRVDPVGIRDNGDKVEMHWGVYLDDHGGPHLKPAGLIGEKPPYGLIFILADPDTGAAMFLEKSP